MTVLGLRSALGMVGPPQATALSEPVWKNESGAIAARNATTTHTIPLGFTATAGRELIVIVGGAVTHAVTGWTERLSPLGSGELSVFTKTAAGGETSITVTHNGSNYPVIYEAYELPEGSGWINGAQVSDSADTFPALTGLPGTAGVMVFAAYGRLMTTGSTTFSLAWGAGWVEDLDTFAPFATTDGYGTSVVHQLNVSGASITPTATVTTNTTTPDRQRIVFAYTVPMPAATIPIDIIKTGGGATTAAASGPKTTTAPTISTKTGSGVPRGAGSGPKVTTAATVNIKTGSGTGVSAGSGPKTTTAPTVTVKTGSGVAEVAASGPEATTVAAVIDKIGGAAARAIGVGARQVVTIVGKTTPGSTVLASSTDKIGVSSAVAPSSGVLSAAHAHIWLSATGSTPARFVVYTDAGGTPGAPVALSDEITVTALTDTVADFTFSGAQQALIVGGNTYWFGPFWKDPGVPSVNIGRDGAAGGRYENSTAVYPTPANPFVPTGAALAGPLATWFEMVPMPAGATITKSGGAVAAGGGSGAKTVVATAYVLDRVTGATNTQSLTHTVTPPGTTVPGDLILVAFTNDTATSVASTNSPDWQMLGSLAQGTTTNHRGSIFAKRATGSDTLVVDLTESQEATWIALRVGTAGDPQVATPLTGAGTPYNLPVFTGDPNDYLAICTVHMDSSADTALVQAVTFPAGFTNVTSRNPTVTSSGATFTAERFYGNTTGITPGTFSPTVGEQWVSFTVAIPPVQTGIIKRGGGIASASGSGARTRTTATTISKTGSAVAGGIASGSKTTTASSVFVKTGAGVSAGVGSGAKATTGVVVSTKTGSGAASGVGAGPKVSVTAAITSKTGAGVARAIGSGAKTVIRVKTGAGAATIAGSGARTTTAPSVASKTGSGVARGAGSGPKVSVTAQITVKTGAGATGVAGVGARVSTTATVSVKTGAGAARAIGAGSKTTTAPTIATKAGSGVARGVGAGARTVSSPITITKAGAAVTAAAGAGVRSAVPVTIIDKAGSGVASVAGSGPEVRTGPPRVVARASGATTGNALTHPITLPPDIAPGNVLIVLFSVDSNKIITTTNTDWEFVGVYSNGSNCSGALFTKIATGDDDLTLTTSGSEESTHISMRAEFASGIRALATNGSSGVPPDAPTLVMVQNDTYYSILGISVDASTDAANVLTPPAGYTNLTTQPTATVQGAISATAERTFTGTTMDPLPWSFATSEQWVAWHIMLIPVGGSAAMILARGGEGAAVGSGSGAKATAATVVAVKAGAAAASAVGSGARTSTAPAVVVKTGSATGRGAGSGARATTAAGVSVKTGAGVAAGVGSGARTVIRTKTGAGVASSTGSGAKLVVAVASNAKTGSGTARATGSGAKSVTTLTKSGSGAAGAAGIVSRLITGPFFSVIKTGSGVAGASAVGVKVFTRPSVRTVTGSALASGAATGTRAFRYDRTGSAAPGANATGVVRYTRARTGGGTAITIGTGARTRTIPITKTGSGNTRIAGTGSKTKTAATAPPLVVTPATVRARTTGATNTDATSHVINLPTATSQDLLLVAFSNDTATANISTADIGWQVLVTAVQGTTTNHRGTILWKRATGSDSLTVTLSTAEAATWVATSVINGADPVGVIANGSLAAGDTAVIPPPITPAHGIDDYLSFITVHVDSSTTTSQTVTPPTDYVNLQSVNPTVGTSAATFTMERAYTDVTTITPDALNLRINEQYVVAHVAIAPLGSGAGGGETTTGLAAPTNFTATWNTTGPKVVLNWTPTPGSDSTQVHEFNADPANTLKATLAYPTGTRTSGTLTNGFVYAYAVRAVRGTEVSPWSIVINISNTGQSVGQAPGAQVGLLPPSNFASAMDGAKVVTSTWTAALGADATEVHEFLVDPGNTLKATIPYPGGSRTAGPLAGGREYLYAARSVKGADLSAWSNAVRILDDGTSQPDVVPSTVPGGGGGGTTGGGTTGTVTRPGDLVDLSKWELTLPTGTAGNPTDIYAGDTPDLKTFSDSNYFRVGQDTDGRWYVEFLAPVTGAGMATTSASSGATRSELRAMASANGGSNGPREAWSFDDDIRHEMTATVTCDPTSIVNGRKEGIIGQIHGATGTPPIYLAANFNGTPKITLFKNGPTLADILTNITTSTKISYRFVKTATNRLQFFFALGDVSALPATPQYDWPSSDFTDNTGCYFKVGAYNKTQLDDPDATGVLATRMYYLTLDGVGWKGVTGGTTTTPAVTTPTTPGEALWIGTARGRNHYNVGIAVSPSTHTDFSASEIADGLSNQWFKLSPDKLWVVFIADIDGATTSSGTKYARSELREKTESDANAAWDGGDSGTHRHKHISKVMHVPPNKPSVVFTQVHDASSDLARVQTEANGTGYKIVMRNTPPGSTSETVRTLVSNYAMGGLLDCSWVLSNGTGQFTLNGTTWTFPCDTPGCYFKTGAYAQTNETIDDASETCEVWVKAGSMQTWHTGYATPTVAPWTTATPTTPTTPGTGTPTGTIVGKTGSGAATVVSSGTRARAAAGGYVKTGGGFGRSTGVGFRIRAHVKAGGGAARGAGVPIRRLERIRTGAAVARGAGASGARAVVNVIPIVRMSGRASANSNAAAHVKNVRVIRRYVGAVASITGEPRRHGIMRAVNITSTASAQPYLINPRLQKPLYASPVIAQATATGRLHRVAKLYRAKALSTAFASRSHLERVTRFRRVLVTADAIGHERGPRPVDTTGFVVADARSRVYRYVAKMRSVARADATAVGNLIKAPRRHIARGVATAIGTITPIRRLRGTTIARSQLIDVQLRVVRHLTSILRYLDQQSVGDVTVEPAAVPDSVEPEVPVYVYEQPFTVLRR